MRFGYADPPYPGLARRYYGCPEVDHVELVAHLEAEFPDGWALSTSGAAARQVWGLCPPDTRLAVFVRGERRVPAKRPRYAWEALFVRGGRSRLRAASEPCGDVLDFRGRQHSHPGALVGMKPAAFASWMFGLLGAGLGDELVDLFPGSRSPAELAVVRCEACDGSGSQPHADGRGGSTCMPCEGTGWTRRASTLEQGTHHEFLRRRLGEVVG